MTSVTETEKVIPWSRVKLEGLAKFHKT